MTATTTSGSPHDLLNADRLDEALAACRSALARNPDDAEALYVLGITLLRQHKPAQAVAMLATAAATRGDATTLNDLAGALREAGRHAEAEAHLRALMQQAPDFAPGLYNLAHLLHDMGRIAEAIPLLRQVAELDPAFPDIRQVLSSFLLLQGNAAYERNEPILAESCYRDALVERPGFAAALNNLGNALVRQVRMTEAFEAYRASLALEPDNENVQFAYGLALLLNGDFTAGWHYHEGRRQVGPMRWNYDRHTELPQWREGMALDGHRVLLMAEQGMGDCIQYVRFARLLAERGVDVVVEAPLPLLRLFQATPDLPPVSPMNEPVQGCDLACPLLSVPLALGTELDTIPATVPYLSVPEEALARWAAWLGPSGGMRRIGIVCSGNERHPHDIMRSIPLARLAPLLSVPGCRFVLVQTDLRDSDRTAREGFAGLRFPGLALGDYADTGALLSHLDLLITVDTSTAHLAGALGLPVWIMLSHAPDYRWLLQRDDSPWYPSMRLFRQGSPGDWDGVIETIRRELTRP